MTKENTISNVRVIVTPNSETRNFARSVSGTAIATRVKAANSAWSTKDESSHGRSTFGTSSYGTSSTQR
jgi:hypothetical protein